MGCEGSPKEESGSGEGIGGKFESSFQTTY